MIIEGQSTTLLLSSCGEARVLNIILPIIAREDRFFQLNLYSTRWTVLVTLPRSESGSTWLDRLFNKHCISCWSQQWRVWREFPDLMACLKIWNFFPFPQSVLLWQGPCVFWPMNLNQFPLGLDRCHVLWSAVNVNTVIIPLLFRTWDNFDLVYFWAPSTYSHLTPPTNKWCCHHLMALLFSLC